MIEFILQVVCFNYDQVLVLFAVVSEKNVLISYELSLSPWLFQNSLQRFY